MSNWSSEAGPELKVYGLGISEKIEPDTLHWQRESPRCSCDDRENCDCSGIPLTPREANGPPKYSLSDQDLPGVKKEKLWEPIQYLS